MPDSNPHPASSPKPVTGVIVPIPLSWQRRLGASLIATLIRLLSSTLRFRWDDQSGLIDNPGAAPVIFSTWHNRLALSMAFYQYVRRRRGSGSLAALISASRDGGLLSGVLERFNVQPVRGSSSRRGRQALLELTSWIERGYDVAITPDGPRGPCYAIQEGVLALAQVTGRPIVPASFHTRWRIRLKSWDRFQIPLPFALCHMKFGEPVRVPRDAGEKERAAAKRELEQAMRRITVD